MSTWKQPTQPEMDFSVQFTAELDRAGLTQAGAATVLDVSKSVVEKWQKGTRVPLAVTQEGVLARLKKLKSKQ